MLPRAVRASRESAVDVGAGRPPSAAPWSAARRRVCPDCPRSASARPPPAAPPGRAPRPGRDPPAPGPTPRSTGRFPRGRRRSARRWSQSGGLLSLRLAPIDHRPDLDQPTRRPSLRHLDGLIQVSHGDLGVAADRLLAFDEGTVGYHRLTVVELDRCRGALGLDLVAAGDLAPVFFKPLVDRGIGRLPLGLRHRFPLLCALFGLAEQQYVFHRVRSSLMVRGPRRFVQYDERAGLGIDSCYAVRRWQSPLGTGTASLSPSPIP